MAITIDYSDGATPQYVIQVPRADMLLVASVPTEIRQLNIDTFRRELDDLMDNDIGMVFETTHYHTPPLTVAGVTLARVVEILDPYVIEFEDGQYNVNIVGGNSNVSDVTVKNQVGVNTANSAGLQDPFALQAASYGGQIAINVNATTSGTTFPFGTRAFPVNNVADLKAVAVERGLREVRILTNMTLGSGDFSDGYQFVGDNQNVLVTLAAAPDVANCEFRNMTIQGDLDGYNTLRECAVLSLNYFNGFIFQCGFAEEITLVGTNTAVILQCFSLVAEDSLPQYPSINLGGTQVTPLVVSDWSGTLTIEGCSDQQAAVSLDMSSGKVVFTDTITDGSDYKVRGIAEVIDNSGPGATVTDDTLTKLAVDNAEVRRIMGLEPGSPLEVSETTRTAGAISQTVTEADGTVTVERV